MILIEDADDSRIALFRATERRLNTRADRRERIVAAGLFIAEGDLVVERALAAGCTPVAAFVDAAAPPSVVDRFDDSVVVYGGDENVRRASMGLGVPLSIVALFRRPDPLPAAIVASLPRVVALEAVDNPVNIGTVVRSAAALGWNGLLLDRTSADPLARRALRVSMGNAFVLPFARAHSLVEAVTDARAAGTLVVAMTPAAGAMPLQAVLPAIGQPAMIMFGSERNGLSDEMLAASSIQACIPMADGVNSMNVAAAAAVACWALRPIRRGQRP